MSSGMNTEQAKEYAKTMTYREAVSNVKYSKFIKYRKATMIKLRELAEIADRLDRKTEPQMWTCPKCGTENHIDYKKCPCCGYDRKTQADTISFTYTEEEWNEIQDWKDRMWTPQDEPQTEHGFNAKAMCSTKLFEAEPQTEREGE